MAQSDAINQTSTTEEKPSGYRSKAIAFLFVIFAITLLGLLVAINSTNKSLDNDEDMSEERIEQATSEAENETKLRGSLQNMFKERGEIIREETLPAAGEVVSQRMPDDNYDRYQNEKLNLQQLMLSQGQQQQQDPKEQIIAAALADDIGTNTSSLDELLPGGQSQSGYQQQPVTANPNSSIQERIAAIQARRDALQQTSRQLPTTPDAGGFGSFPAVGQADLGSAESVGSNSSNEISGIGYDDAGQDPEGMLIPPTTVIDAVLNQALNTDGLGECVALIRHNVYDISRSYVLIPEGSKASCEVVNANWPNEAIQNRMAIAVKEVIRPDGSIIKFDDLTASNFDGSGGIPSDVDRHLLAQTLGTLAYALIGNGPELLVSGDTQTTNQAAAADVYGNMSDQFQPLSSKYLNIVPTKSLPRGWPIKIIVNQTLKVKPYRSVEPVNFGDL